LRFDDVVGDRIISPIRKTDTQAREIEATSVDSRAHCLSLMGLPADLLQDRLERAAVGLRITDLASP
jgi:hypothetical protein